MTPLVEETPLAQHPALPPSPLPDIFPTGGEIGQSPTPKLRSPSLRGRCLGWRRGAIHTDFSALAAKTLRTPARLLAAGAALALLCGQPALGADTAENQSEVERFCGNIADAARDRRYQLQTEELQKLQGEIDKRMAALEAKRVEVQGWMKKRDDFIGMAEDSVVKIYRTMKPDAAAERLAALRTDLAAAILLKLEPKRAGTILNEMETKQAAVLTGIMVNAARKEDPS